MLRKTLLLTVIAAAALPVMGQFSFSSNTTNDPTAVFVSTGSPCGPAAQISWDYGDGSWGYGSTSSHTYSNNGTYVVCAFAVDSATSCYASFCDSVTINNAAPAPCSAVFSVYDSVGVAYLWPNNYYPNTTYFWDLGDGTTSTSAYPQHTYAPGTYTVCLTITTGTGCTDTWCDSIVVGAGINCNANFTSSANGLVVDFTDVSSSADPITFWNWDFGDGNYGSTQNPTHTYAAGGTYLVCLTVGNNNCMDSYCGYVIVSGPAACQAGFYAFPDSSQPNTTWIINTSTSPNPASTTYFWDFGDGNTSNQPSPTHVYATTGIYVVCLTITDGINCTSTYCDSVLATPKANQTWTINCVTSGATAVQPAAGNISALFPNPATDFATLKITLERSMNAEVALVNVMGQTVRSQQQNLSAGETSISLDLQNLPAGLYFVKVSDLSGNMKPIQSKLVKN